VRMQVRLGRIELESNMLLSFVMFVSLYSNVKLTYIRQHRMLM
jgi:hypothetical protein